MRRNHLATAISHALELSPSLYALACNLAALERHEAEQAAMVLFEAELTAEVAR